MLKERVRSCDSDSEDDDEDQDSSDSEDYSVETAGDNLDDEPSDVEEVSAMEDPWPGLRSAWSQYVALGVASTASEMDTGTVVSFPNWIQVSVLRTVFLWFLRVYPAQSVEYEKQFGICTKEQSRKYPTFTIALVARRTRTALLFPSRR